MPLPRGAAVLLSLLCSCNPAPAAPAASSTNPPVSSPAITEAPGAPHGKRCLPIVSGCGCAYGCAHTLRVHANGSHEVIHEFQDSRSDTAVIQTWCFDSTGHGEPRKDGHQSGCRDVFYDGSACAGECVASTRNLSCAWSDGSCEVDSGGPAL